MNKFKYAFPLIFVLIFFLTNGCKKEEEENNNPQQLTYDCENNDCTAKVGGQYISLSDCLSQCGGGSIVSYNCINGSCIDPGDGSGIYSTITNCQSQCGNVSASYDCINNECIDPGDGSGEYANLQDCQEECFVSSCPTSSFTVSNQGNYELNGVAELIHFGNIWNSTVNYEIRLFTSNITGNANGPSYSGIGELILFDLHTNGSPEGTYTFYANSFPPNPPVNTCTPKFFIGQDMSVYSQCMAFPQSGSSIITLNIIDNGANNYNIEFAFNTSSGLIEGCFSGNLYYWDTSGSGSGSSGVGKIISSNDNPEKW